MKISVSIHEGPLAARPAAALEIGGAVGALLRFEGLVREFEGADRIAALDYEVYEPMATRALHRLAEDVAQCGDVLEICVEHSRGRVPVGQCSFRLRVAAAHRGEALRAVELFVDRMKQDVPIWKTPVYAEGGA